jgi:SOS response regulatory protein OraA/RecX
MAQRKTRKLEGEALWGFALRALGGRAYSIAELRERLKRRAARATDVEDILTRLKRAGYLNDRQFAEAFAESRLSSRGFGPRRVLRDLRLKRVAPKVAEEAVSEAYRGADEVQLQRVPEGLSRRSASSRFRLPQAAPGGLRLRRHHPRSQTLRRPGGRSRIPRGGRSRNVEPHSKMLDLRGLHLLWWSDSLDYELV